MLPKSLLFLLLSACIIALSPCAHSQDDPAAILESAVNNIDEQVSAIEDALQNGVKDLSDEETEALKEIVNTLKPQLADVSKRLTAIDKSLSTKKPLGKADRKQLLDPMPFASKWEGKLWVKDSNNKPLHEGVANAEIIARDPKKGELTIRVTLKDDHIWEYNFASAKPRGYKIESADQKTVPRDSTETPGKVSIRDSAANFENGVLWIELNRPINGQTRIARYELKRLK